MIMTVLKNNKTGAAADSGGGGELELRDLILTLKGDRTYAGLEAASGGVVRAQRFHQIANGVKLNEFPEPRTLSAMALALNCSVETVLFSYARALGLGVSRQQSTFANMLPPMADDLTDRQQAAVLGVIRAMNDAREVQDEGYFIASKNADPGLPAS